MSTDVADPSNAANVAALKHSQQLVSVITDVLLASGRMPFQQFMQMALYQPGLGYYTAGAVKFGAAGDFITAPEATPLFARCLAEQCQQLFAVLPEQNILEFGAGTGKLAVGLLQALAKRGSGVAIYYIIEPSPMLRQVQLETISQACPEQLAQVRWLQSLAEVELTGVMIANEVLDAFPVQRLALTADGASEQYIDLADGAFVTEWSTPSLTHPLLASLENWRELALPYITEYSPLLPPWLATVADHLSRGALLLVDYGFPRRSYYHPDRSMGTLMCHHRHRAHPDPFAHIGLQDITAHVDFTAVAEAGDMAGLTLAGYTEQANFLLNCGLLEALVADNELDRYAEAQQVKLLTLPSEMGELFKVMAFTKQCDIALKGFQRGDKSRRL